MTGISNPTHPNLNPSSQTFFSLLLPISVNGTTMHPSQLQTRESSLAHTIARSRWSCLPAARWAALPACRTVGRIRVPLHAAFWDWHSGVSFSCFPDNWASPGGTSWREAFPFWIVMWLDRQWRPALAGGEWLLLSGAVIFLWYLFLNALLLAAKS